MGKKVRIQLAPEDRERLEGLIANGNTPQKHVRRARIVDPDLIAHRAYGVPQSAVTPEIWQAIGSAYGNLARELQLQVPEDKVRETIGRLDGFEVTESEKAEFQRHQIQFTAQFLVDRDVSYAGPTSSAPGKALPAWTNSRRTRSCLRRPTPGRRFLSNDT